jgi:hypothetical protein
MPTDNLADCLFRIVRTLSSGKPGNPTGGKARMMITTHKSCAAAASKKDIRYLRRLRAERRVPTYIIGGRVFFDLAELDEFTEAQRTEVVAR